MSSSVFNFDKPKPNSYEELILRSIDKYNAMPPLNISGDEVPRTFNERTTDTYIKWAQEGKSYLQLAMKKQDFWDPDQNVALMEQ